MTTALDDVFGIDPLLSEEERGWARSAREFATRRILPTVEQDFEDRYFRAELIGELGANGFLGMHLRTTAARVPARSRTDWSATSWRRPTAAGAPSSRSRAPWR